MVNSASETGPASLGTAPADAAPVRTRLRSFRAIRALPIVAFWVLVLLGAILAAAAVWVLRTFGPISVDQLVLNLGGGGEGAGGGAVVRGAVLQIIVVPAVVVLVFVVLGELSRRALRSAGVLRGWRCAVFRSIAVVLAVAVPLGGAVVFGSAIGVDAYLRAQARLASGEATVADYYVEPAAEAADAAGGAASQTGTAEGGSLAPARRNLVVIYLESVENAFSDETRFERNMLEPVQRATETWEEVPALRQYDGGGWTMAGIVGTQCGVPLRTPGALLDSEAMNALGTARGDDGSATYLAGATCLGDVLSREGYRNVYLGGADASFAGKRAFLETHGYDAVHDLEEWRELGETEVREDWGLSDRRLFARAKEEVTRLHESEQPFNLTMLTLDTHEIPVLYDSCPLETESPLTSITFCSMQQVAGFIDYMDEQGILEDTAVVVMGDHTKMIGENLNFWREMRDLDEADRSIFNRIWSPDGVSVERDELDQLSMYPTLLELAGVPVPTHRAGLGVSAFVSAEDAPRGTMLDLGSQEYDDLLLMGDPAFYGRLWGGQQPEAAPE